MMHHLNLKPLSRHVPLAGRPARQINRVSHILCMKPRSVGRIPQGSNIPGNADTGRFAAMLPTCNNFAAKYQLPHIVGATHAADRSSSSYLAEKEESGHSFFLTTKGLRYALSFIIPCSLLLGIWGATNGPLAIANHLATISATNLQVGI